MLDCGFERFGLAGPRACGVVGAIVLVGVLMGLARARELRERDPRQTGFLSAVLCFALRDQD